MVTSREVGRAGASACGVAADPLAPAGMSASSDAVVPQAPTVTAAPRVRIRSLLMETA
jgi:hypothetical protein